MLVPDQDPVQTLRALWVPKTSSALVRTASLLQLRRTKPHPLRGVEGTPAAAVVGAALLAGGRWNGAQPHSNQLIFKLARAMDAPTTATVAPLNVG